MTLTRAGKVGTVTEAECRVAKDQFCTNVRIAPDSHKCPKCGSELLFWIHSDDDGPGYTKIANCKCGHQEKGEERHYVLETNWEGKPAWILCGHEEKVKDGEKDEK